MNTKDDKNHYKPNEIESKWQEKWEADKVFSPDIDNAKNPYFNLMMFPYPSAEGLHVGNMYAFTGADVYAKFNRMQGKDVLEPIGLDGFGIHSENYALKIGVHPKEQAEIAEKNFYRQLRSIGNSFDWSRTVETYNPNYYKWTQWLFIKLFEAGLAYRKKAQVNWCPKDLTVLSDEQVIDGKCERCGSEVQKRELEQWFFRITNYAEKLLSNIEDLDWSNKVKIAQRNWIGKSLGAEVEFGIQENSNYVLLHGFTGSVKNDFFPSLRERLGSNVWAEDLPDSSDPDAEKQAEFVLSSAQIDENTVLLGHSFGSVTALKLLEKIKKPIKRLVLAAGFAQPGFLDHERVFESKTNWEFDFEAIKRNVKEVIILRASNDSAVPRERADFLKEKLGGKIVDFEAEADHITGIKEPVILENLKTSIKVFTTRPDTLFGATFMVLSPEHEVSRQIVDGIFKKANVEEVKEYIENAKSKTEAERTENKEKTGIFSGLFATNPVNNEDIPIWIADYVLSGYGTGAIMAVPAHDERDFEFAKKYSLPIRQVVMPENGNPKEGEERRDGGAGVIFDPKRQKYAVFQSPVRNNFIGLFAGGTEPDEDEQAGVMREITEESGLHNFSYIEGLGYAFAHFYSGGRKSYRVAKASGYLVILENDDLIPTKLEEHEQFSLVWKDPQEILKNWNSYEDLEGIRHWERFLTQGVARAIELGYDKTNKAAEFKTESYEGKGILVNSGEWDDLRVPADMDKVLESLEDKGLGKKKANYHLRDWLISRQRYWGPPIPMIFCSTCAKNGKARVAGMEGWFPVPIDQLPIELPDVADWKPMGTGKSPLANHPEFFEVKCPNCGGKAVRETDVSDTFLDSSWYFLRYPSTDISTNPFDIDRTSKWLPVHMYIGGAEHAVLHLLYARFVTMVLNDLGYLNFEEPFSTFFGHGLIIKDGVKMSKSKGNVVVPDEYIVKYGADTLRSYLMFIGPYSDGGDFRDTGIEGMNKFLRKVWKMLSTTGIDSSQAPLKDERLKMMHKTIKMVTEDISKFSYNTSIARLMEWYNFLSLDVRSNKSEVSSQEKEVFLKLLAPFAPHMTEELWQKMESKSVGVKAFRSIHLQPWPEVDESFLTQGNIVIPVQINGKRRGEILLSTMDSEDSVGVENKAREAVSKQLHGIEVKKVIYISGKIINFVV